jgi:3-oxoacyl-[acyl-carrier protein] reductase
MNNPPPLTGAIALVTGASRGLGEAIAHRLARDGAYVVGTATRSEGAERIGARLESEGLTGEGRVLDVTDSTTVTETIEAVGRELGPVTILVNNAGITADNLLMRMKETEWSRVMDVNLNAVYRVSKACLRGMSKARQGRIINIASVVGVTGNPGQTNYAAAKAGMTGFSKSLARELGGRGVTVNVVAPGFIDTDMTRALPDDQKTRLLEQIPLARLGSPEDIAAAVAFLASPGAGYITGETLHVNGGMAMS